MERTDEQLYGQTADGTRFPRYAAPQEKNLTPRDKDRRVRISKKADQMRNRKDAINDDPWLDFV